MKWVVSLAIAGGIAGLGFAAVLDLGDLNQYNTQLTIAPSTGTNAVWLGQGPEGYNIALSSDIKSKVQGVLDGCGEFNDNCFQDVTDVFSRADVEIDGALDRRGFASLLSKTFRSYGGLFIDITMILMAMFRMRQQEVQELGIWIPNSRASDVGSIATATDVTVSAGGTAFATITKRPDVTQLQGSATPIVTAVTAPSDGYVAGDLVALLDEDLASRIDEFMRRTTVCQDGQTFDSQHPSTKKLAGSSLGQAICAAEAVAAGAVPGGPFNDLLLLSPTNLPFGFSDAAGAVAQAAGVVGDFVQAYAPLLSISPDLADQLTVYIFALAMDTIVENIPLTNKNRIQSSMITTSSATRTTVSASSSSSSCPDPAATTLSCGMDGEDCDIKMPVAPATQATCESGKYQNCRCQAPPVISVNLVLPVEQQAMIRLSALLKNAAAPPVQHSADCQAAVSPIPANVFSSDQNKVYSHFCDEWHSDKASNVTVDSSGNEKGSQLRRRTPPPDATVYKDWSFDLSFTPTTGAGKCLADCNEAYSQLGHACTSYGNPVAMHSSGTLDVDCGVFGFNIYQETTALAEHTRFCYGAGDFGPMGSIDRGTVRLHSNLACAGTALKTVKKDDKSTFIQSNTANNNVPYQYNIWWRDGCTLDNNGPTEVFASNPLGIDNPGYTDCQDYLIGDYEDCTTNAGVGGYIQVGCLIYEFMANSKPRVFI